MKYFGTDGIRGQVNSGNINGDMFFKFGLAAGKYFTNLKKRKQTAIIAKDTRLSGYALEPALVSGLNFDKNSIKTLKKHNTPFVLQHSLGNPDVMQKNPKYKNVLLDIYDFFEEKLNNLRQNGIYHNNIILDPGIGFGKNLKHNMTCLLYTSPSPRDAS